MVMIWKILIIVSLVLSLWSAWASWQNTKSLENILKSMSDEKLKAQ